MLLEFISGSLQQRTFNMSDFSPLLPMYPNPPRGTIPSFHADLNMSPSKAAKVIMGNAQMAKGKGKAKSRGRVGKVAKAYGRMPSRGNGGARVFGWKK